MPEPVTKTKRVEGGFIKGAKYREWMQPACLIMFERYRCNLGSHTGCIKITVDSFICLGGGKRLHALLGPLTVFLTNAILIHVKDSYSRVRYLLCCILSHPT